MDLSIVIPCLNEASHLEDSVRQLRVVLDGLGRDYELVFVDDGSRDATPAILTRLAQEDASVTALLLDRTTGYGSAATQGIRRASGAVVGLLDIDLEVHARHIPIMLSCIEERGADAASAYRIYRMRPGVLLRYTMTHVYRWLVNHWLGLPLRDTGAGFKFFRRDALLPLLDQVRDPRWFWHTEVMAKAYLAGQRIAEISCPFERRRDKASTVKPVRDTLVYLRCLWAFKPRFSRHAPRTPHREYWSDPTGQWSVTTVHGKPVAP